MTDPKYPPLPSPADTLRASHDDLQRRLAERDQTIADLRDHLSRETKSAEAAGAIADELSVALEASRALVADRDDHLMAIRAALGCDDGATTIVAEVTRLREACAATVADARLWEQQVESLQHQLDHSHSVADDLRDRMADPEGMAPRLSPLRPLHPEDR